MQITKSDVVWNYGATFLKIASSVLLFPSILKMMPAEKVGIWSIFMTITAFAGLLDLGFSSSFTRNVTYVFSGVNNLKINGFEFVSTKDQNANYGLLKAVITAMRWFYLRMAIILFLFLSTFGTYYIYTLLINYKGEKQEIYIAWALLCAISTYNLFTLYYDALLQGKGLVKRSKQIVIVGQTVYLAIATILILYGFGLVAIVSAQASSVIIIRWLSYNSFFTREIKQKLLGAIARSQKEILKAIYPNALKIGLTTLGGFMVQRSSIIIGSLYLTLEDIGSYGITIQLIAVLSSLAGIYTATYQPMMTNLRINNSNSEIKKLYLKGQIIMVITFIFGGTGMLFLGEWALNFIGSQTKLMSFSIILIALLVSMLETNLSIAGNILLTKNIVPFFKASLLSGFCIVLGLVLGFNFTNLGLYIMVLVPLIVDLLYSAWKWPLEVIKELEITADDYYLALKNFIGIGG